MPAPTPDDIRDTAAADAQAGVASFTSGDQTVSTRDPEALLRVADKLAARDALAGPGAGGGAKSGFRLLRPAIAVPRGDM